MDRRAGDAEGDPASTGRRIWPPLPERIVAARNGDRRALGEILTQGFPKLVAFYRAMGLSFADAEDLASEACEGMVRNLRRLREPGAFEGWFWTVARNRLRSRIRRKGRPERELDFGSADDPSDLAVLADEHARIRAALAELAPRDRQILWLREVEGLAHEEIGGRLGLATGAVRVAALRARRRLEEIYARSDHGGE
jgi:RNA polymerase sigma-70 factor (ECF subfamily)